MRVSALHAGHFYRDPMVARALPLNFALNNPHSHRPFLFSYLPLRTCSRQSLPLQGMVLIDHRKYQMDPHETVDMARSGLVRQGG